MKQIAVPDELYEKLKGLKNGKSFAEVIRGLLRLREDEDDVKSRLVKLEAIVESKST